MNLEKLRQKYKIEGREVASQILKVNRYENPQEALNLVAHICTKGADIKLQDCLRPFTEELDAFKKQINERNFQMANRHFFEVCEDILSGFGEGEASTTFTVAVAGGYSSGKSSLLNALTGLKDMLPTGIEPVSMVNTDINLVPGLENINILGRNIKNEIISLDKDVLACIQHSSKSKVYIASVLQKLTIEVPANQSMNNICFIDTPGYNNSDALNIENGTTDKETALIALERADAVIWCIDIEAGTITDSDLKMLNTIKKDVPIVVVFTKKDKKSEDETKKIIAEAKKICERKMPGHTLKNILAVCTGDKGKIEIYGNEKINFQNLFNDLKKKSSEQNHSGRLYTLFRQEIQVSDILQERLEEKRKKLIDRKRYASRTEIESLEDETDDVQNKIKECKAFHKFMEDELEKLKNITDSVERKCREETKRILSNLHKMEKHDESDIFSAIRADNMKRFLACFSKGVNLTSLDSKKEYSPLTAAVASGNNEMVNFFIDHIKDKTLFRERDGKGYNMFETAIINHYKDICELLLKADSNISKYCKPLNELLNKNTFEQWIKAKIR